MSVRWLLMLYPRAWRDRYGREFQALLEQERIGPAVMLDVIAGALDARFAPQHAVTQVETIAKGGVMQILSTRCASDGLSRAEQRRSALSMAAAIIGLSIVYVWLKRVLPGNAYVEAFGHAVFPFAAALTTVFYLNKHSLAARIMIGVAFFAMTYLAAVVAAWL